MTKVAIVILNYNGRAFLQKFLPTVLRYSEGFEVWVADNASTDQSLEWLKDAGLPVQTLSFDTNEGYAGGYNRALKQISAEYFILLNSDIEVTENWIEPVIALLDAEPNIAACQPKICAYDLPSHFEYAGAAGGHLDYLGYPFCRGRIFDTREEDLGQYDDEVDIFWATGACLFVRSEVFAELGGFDEIFFAHMEEIDFCWRLKQRGYRVAYCGHSRVYHVGGGTLHKSNPRKTFLNYRNNLIMLYKNLSGADRVKVIGIRLFLDGLSSFRFIAAGAFPDVLAIIKAHFAFYRLIPRLFRSSGPKKKVRLYPKSVVWEYFGLGRHTFAELKGSVDYRPELPVSSAETRQAPAR
ncbi:glycosyltransferase family 2 protein [Ravibacter arvi]|uniref:Glycosyltransferase family 2 protein n=1 Tax=Ravibacter arvi TaxID=2051041 RepID=A0ABP8LU51_9BACT